MSLLAGLQVTCVGCNHGSIALQCALPMNLLASGSATEEPLRWTIHRTKGEFLVFGKQVEIATQGLVSLRSRKGMLQKLLRCGCSRERLDAQDIETFLKELLSDLEGGWLVRESTQQVVARFFEISRATAAVELEKQTKLIEGLLRKQPVHVHSEQVLTNVLFCLQVGAFVATALLYIKLHSLFIAALVASSTLLLAGTDYYLIRPSEPNRTLIVPCILVPVFGWAALGGYAIYVTFIRQLSPRWFVLRDRYLIYSENYLSHKPKGVFALDQETVVIKSWWHPYFFKVTNANQELRLWASSKAERQRWITAIEGMVEHSAFPPKGYYSAKHTKVPAQWYVSAEMLWQDIDSAFAQATYEILIAGWMISPEVRLTRRRGQPGQTLEQAIRAAVARGVKVHILLYREVEMALPNSSRYAKEKLIAAGAEVIRHASSSRSLAAPSHLIPGIGVGSTWFSHHEKLVIVDQHIAFVGGIDLAFARYDTLEHSLVDPSGDTWPGKDFYNVQIKEFEDLHDPHTDLIDRKSTCRMPWQDIHACVGGEACRDIAHHFIMRWNSELHELRKEGSHTATFHYLSGCHYRDVSHLESFLPYVCDEVQALRSIGAWSHVLKRETSILKEYIQLIRSAKSSIYIENQFFTSMEIVEALGERLERAYDAGDKDFSVVILLPQWPAFEGMPHENSMTKIVLYHQHVAMDKLYERLERKGMSKDEATKRLLVFCSLRKVEQLGEQLHTSQIYVHSKLLITDDEHCIIGSANLNKRSLDGDRDTEVCVYIKSQQYAKDLRTSLFAQHLGLHPKSCPGCRMCSLELHRSLPCDLSTTHSARVHSFVTDELVSIAKSNAETLIKLFPGYQPSDKLTTLQALKVAIEQARQVLPTSPQNMKEANSLQGTIVSTPLLFLRDERSMLPSVTRDIHLYFAPEDVFS